MFKLKQPPSKSNSIFYTKNLTNFTSGGSYSLDLVEMRKNNTQIIKANKTMRLQKIKRQISMHLRNKKNYVAELNENSDKKPSQSVYLNEQQTKYQSLMKRLRNHNGYESQRSNQHTSHNQRPLRRRRQNTQNKNRVMQLRRNNKDGINQQILQQLHKKSFTIKQIKPEKKQRITKQMPICDPTFGKTYGSYYQIVAIQKRFFNSRYFLNGQTFNMLGGDRYQEIDQKYNGKVTSYNLQPKRGSKILYEGDVIEPWNLQDDNQQMHDGFD